MTGSLTVETSIANDMKKNGTYHFLDVGGVKYGECILLEFGATRILIDGSHVEDFDGQHGYRSIPEQIQSILGGNPPYDIDLIVVTHCHADHVGCLPELFSKGIIKPTCALLTDPKLGFGRTEGEDASTQDLARPAVRLAALLREEDASDLDDRELRAFVDAVSKVEARYNAFVKNLKARGVEVILYRGQGLPSALVKRLAATNIQLLGPTADQLLLCADQISKTNEGADDIAADADLRDDADLVRLYRSIIEEDADASGYLRGNGMNCQSITLALGPPEARVLLAGDMQFSQPGVKGVDKEMKMFRQRVVAAGPYKLFKTTHHTSHNGQDEDFLAEIGDPELIVHSGGLRDDDHPGPTVLQMLKQRGRIKFARTDRNGVISVKPHLSPDRAIDVTRGRLNDFTPNRPRDEMREGVELETRSAEEVTSTSASTSLSTSTTAAGVQIVIVNLPNAPVNLSVAGVDIQLRPSPERAITQPQSGATTPPNGPGGRQVPEGEPGGPRPPSDLSITRSLARLLFVTDREGLRRNIGKSEADAALAAIEKAGGVLQVSRGEDALDKTQATLSGAPDIRGVVLLGGYDVIPPARTDAIGAELRNMLKKRVNQDADQFWVWSDKLYGDRDGDAVAEYAVSRVPDARDPQLFRAAISAAPLRLGKRFGIRNVYRGFAETVWGPQGLGPRPLEVSEKFLSTDVNPSHLDSACHYFMLHGAESDGTEFSGEDSGGGYPVAFTVRNVPPRFNGVVFSGCCWGALIVDGKASQATSGMPAPRKPAASIALSYLKAGAVAFIGCTGSHYSGPDPDLDDNYAARLHRDFWFNLAQPATAPAAALHRAKQTYLRWIMEQRARLDPLDTARRLKNFSQFTCLGLGW